MAGEFNSSQHISLQHFTLPELAPKITLPSLDACVFQAPCRYNMIIGRDILRHFQIVLNFHNNEIKTDTHTIPMRTFPRMHADSAALALHIHTRHIHQITSDDSFAITTNKTVIQESTYDQHGVRTVCNKCTHLTNNQREQLHSVLCKYQTIFDGTLKHYPDEEIHLDIDPTIKPNCSGTYPVPHKQLPLFKKELD